jgi:hypothetical protein
MLYHLIEVNGIDKFKDLTNHPLTARMCTNMGLEPRQVLPLGLHGDGAPFQALLLLLKRSGFKAVLHRQRLDCCNDAKI